MRIDLNTITQYQKEQCELFAKHSASSSLSEYKKRNQSDKDKIVSDIYNGKEAEFLVYNFLIAEKKKLESPDLNIYEGYRKSYDADLSVGDIDIHVKSHKVNSNFPVSWVFQKKDPLLSQAKDSDYIALVVMENGFNYMYLRKVSEVEFREPQKKSLRDTKACVYQRDLLKTLQCG